jgi:hypothetical protein
VRRRVKENKNKNEGGRGGAAQDESEVEDEPSGAEQESRWAALERWSWGTRTAT